MTTDILHIVTIFFNYCEYQSRYKIANEFITRYTDYPDSILYVVELVYGNQQFKVTKKNNPNHLQLRTENPLWHKENLINLGIEKLLPKNWKYVAWIDCCLTFDNHNFVKKTIDKLKNNDVVQMYKHIKYGETIKDSFQYHQNSSDKKNKFHILQNTIQKTNDKHIGSAYTPGGALACTKKAYMKMGGLYDKCIVGGGDDVLMHCSINKNIGNEIYKNNIVFIKSIDKYMNNIKNLKFNYVSNILIYVNHGNRKNRQYSTRQQILSNFNPETDLQYINGIIQLKKRPDIQENINKMFFTRKEDKE